MNFTTFNFPTCHHLSAPLMEWRAVAGRHLLARSGAPILAGLALALGGGVLVASAQTYVPLAKLPIGEGGASPDTWTLATYLTGAIKLLVASAGALAVVMLIIGGTQYVAAGINPSAKGDAKERIMNALIGLTLVLTSYLILYSIDPNLTKFSLTLPPLSVTPATTAPDVTATATAQPWPGDASERSQLATKGIVVKTPTCTTIGEPEGCASVYGLGAGAINGLGALKASCPACSITVTAGTEYWLHGNKSTDLSSNTTGHRPGNSVVDIRKGSSNSLDTKIFSSILLPPGGCSNLGLRYRLNGAVYVNEGNHWHVCY